MLHEWCSIRLYEAVSFLDIVMKTGWRGVKVLGEARACKTYIFKDYILRKIYVGRFLVIRLTMGEAGVDLVGRLMLL